MSTECASAKCTRRAYTKGYCEPHATALDLRSPYQPAQQLREAVETLTNAGWTLQQIVDHAGLVSRRHLYRIMWQQDHVGAKTLNRVEALCGRKPPEGNTCIAWPYTRRLRSLRAAGHSAKTISAETGVHPAQLSAIANNRVASGRIWATTADAIDEYWRAHYSDPVSTPDRSARGWVPPMWWDDIDDPGEQPGITHCLDCHAPFVEPSKSLYCQKCRWRIKRQNTKKKARTK